MAATTKENGQRNVLDILEKLQGYEGEAEFEEKYIDLRRDFNVLRNGHKPTRFQLCQYIDGLQRGFEYTRDVYGEESLPTSLIMDSGVLRIGEKEEADWIGYFFEHDAMAVSLLHIAGQCANYGNENVFFKDQHLMPDQVVQAQDYTVLQTIEEGHHRLLIKTGVIKPERTERNINHPLEQAIIPVWQRAIKDLRLKTYNPKEI